LIVLIAFDGRSLARLSVRDPLNRSRRHAKPRGDLMKSWPPRSRQSVTDSLFHLGASAGAAEGFAALGAARLGPGNAGAHPLDNHAPLELGKHTHHLKHGLAGRRRGVDALLMQGKVDAERVQLREEADQVLKRPRRSTDHAMTISNLRREASLCMASKPGRLSRPLEPEMPSSASA
jgi:hypothetical protein